MPAPLTLRPQSAEDRPFLFRLYASTREREIQSWGWNELQAESFLRMQFGARTASYGAIYAGADRSILLDGTSPIGAMIVSRTAREIRLVDIAFLTEHRNRGLGSYLISELIGEAEAAHLPLRLSVVRGNPALRLYQRLGFVVTGDDAMYLEMEHGPQRTQ